MTKNRIGEFNKQNSDKVDDPDPDIQAEIDGYGSDNMRIIEESMK